jgi:hypothetical protein
LEYLLSSFPFTIVTLQSSRCYVPSLITIERYELQPYFAAAPTSSFVALVFKDGTLDSVIRGHYFLI